MTIDRAVRPGCSVQPLVETTPQHSQRRHRPTHCKHISYFPDHLLILLTSAQAPTPTYEKQFLESAVYNSSKRRPSKLLPVRRLRHSLCSPSSLSLRSNARARKKHRQKKRTFLSRTCRASCRRYLHAMALRHSCREAGRSRSSTLMENKWSAHGLLV